MTSSPPSVALIDDGSALSASLPRLAAESRIALDTEADSLHCYFEKLCLIQISVPGGDFLVDPLAGFSIEPLFAALAGKELILHGLDYDLRLLRRVGFSGTPQVFDTAIAARLCGVTEFSLAALIDEHFGVKLTKASQKANWARRPLPVEMAEYAVNDTRFLHRLADIFTARLHELDRWSWFVQACDRAVRATETSRERDAEDAWRIPGSGLLRGRSAAILRELWRWRDAEARAIDRPAFHILHNEQLLAAVDRIDKGGLIEFKHLRGPRLKRFQEAAHRALELPESQWPVFVRNPRPRRTKQQESKLQELKTRRDRTAANLNIDPALIAPKSALEAIAADPSTAEKLMPWQRQLLAV